MERVILGLYQVGRERRFFGFGHILFMPCVLIGFGHVLWRFVGPSALVTYRRVF